MKALKIITRALVITIVVFYWTIARHEGSHALMAWLEGAEIQSIRLFPGFLENVGFYFAYVKHSGNTSWLTEAAPYFSDILLILITTIILLRWPNIRFYNAFLLLGFLSPIIDLVYNYQGGLWRPGTDVADLLQLLPGIVVHFFFIATITVSILLLRYFRKRKISTS